MKAILKYTVESAPLFTIEDQSQPTSKYKYNFCRLSILFTFMNVTEEFYEIQINN